MILHGHRLIAKPNGVVVILPSGERKIVIGAKLTNDKQEQEIIIDSASRPLDMLRRN